MKWAEVRQIYPHQWLKLKVNEKHIDGDIEYVDDMDVIKTIPSDAQASQELGRCKENEAVYHTYHEDIHFTIKRIFAYRKAR